MAARAGPSVFDTQEVVGSIPTRPTALLGQSALPRSGLPHNNCPITGAAGTHRNRAVPTSGRHRRLCRGVWTGRPSPVPMKTEPRRGGRSDTAADRTAHEATTRFLTPWTVAEVCTFLGCTDRHLRALRADPGQHFPAPLALPVLRWWPPDILTWAGLDLDEVLTAARATDPSRS